MSVTAEDMLIDAPAEALVELIAEDVSAFFATGDVRILSWVAIDSTHIQVTFVAAVEVSGALRCVELWLIDPPVGARDIAVRAVEVVGDPATAVILTVDEMLNGGGYTGDIATIREV